jgi:hypothetical protein
VERPAVVELALERRARRGERAAVAVRDAVGRGGSGGGGGLLLRLLLLLLLLLLGSGGGRGGGGRVGAQLRELHRELAQLLAHRLEHPEPAQNLAERVGRTVRHREQNVYTVDFNEKPESAALTPLVGANLNHCFCVSVPPESKKMNKKMNKTIKVPYVGALWPGPELG